MRVALLGPIGHWWTCWDSPDHQTYIAHRSELHDALVTFGHLVYSPHNAWKGQWVVNDGDRVAQAVNDAAIRAAHVALNLTPDNVPSPGTDHEMRLCWREDKPVIAAPPDRPIGSVLAELADRAPQLCIPRPLPRRLW